MGLLKARGPQRLDSTHVLAAIRVLSRLELVAETLRAALNDLATVAPDWRQALAPREWYARDGKRIEDSRLPRAKAAREAYAQTVGEDVSVSWMPSTLLRLPRLFGRNCSGGRP